jgi:two-component system, NtrC family, sensor kinase
MSQAESQEPSQPSINILVVDDTPDSLRLLVSILAERGYKVRAALNGKRALMAAQKLPPDLILLDINMPDLDGYEVCRQLKQDERTHDIPVIFLSAWSDVFDKVKAFAAGGVDYITKPFQIEETVARIKTHLTICTLQKTLQQKNEDLIQTLTQLKATQNHLIQTERMAALGQLAANVAHEINTPLGAIHSSAEVINYFLTENLEPLTHLLQSVAPEHRDLFFLLLQRSIKSTSNLAGFSSREKRQFKRSLQQQLEGLAIPEANIVADTLVDVGIYDQIDPFVNLLTHPESRQILNTVYQLSSLQKSTHIILSATDRAAKTVLALKRYVHQDLSSTKTETDVIEGIETALTLHLNQIKRGVTLIRNYADFPVILAFPDQLNQIWTNLFSNALYAMNYQGILTIAVTRVEPDIRIDITDTGSGISPKLQPQIFEPFFTTKPTGEGSGLGLSIVKKIVEQHTGRIEVNSQPGQTTFSVFLPLHGSQHLPHEIKA